MAAKVKVWSVAPISSEKILPTTQAPRSPRVRMTARACRGQYVPLSFCVRSSEPLVGLRVETTYPDGWEVVVHIVKCWWQSNDKTGKHGRPVFTPELLLKDTALVVPDMDDKRNIIRRPVQDATKLQPIYLPANTTQQYWITFHISDDAPAAAYPLHVQLRSRNVLLGTYPIEIEVLPFELEQPDVDCGVYCVSILAESNDKPQIGARMSRTKDRYRAEMENLARHGITSPTFDQPLDDFFEEAIEIRREAGIKVDPLY
ncbi:hypothetical protein LCGC14_2700690, partial [marine sediment metagenome]